MKNLILSSKLFALIFVLFSTVYIGCQKDEARSNETKNQSNIQLRTTVTPTVENGTLKFNHKEDVVSYMKEISNILDADQTFVNDFPGFNSIYKIKKELEILTGSNETYFIDDRLNAILNENYEVMIGDRVYVKKNLDETWSVHKTDLIGLNKLRQKLPGDYFKPENDSESFLMEDGDKIEVFEKVSCKAKMRIIDKTVSDSNVPLLSTSNGISTYCVEVFGVQGGNVQSITVDWGDGTPPTTSPFNQCHTYTIRGDFSINVAVKLTCNSTPFTSTRLVSPFTNCCKLKSKDNKDVIIGDLLMKASYERKVFLTSFYWLAETRSFAIGGNKVNANLTSQITALFRDHANCNELSNEGDSDSCGSCRSKKVDLWHNENDNSLNKHSDVSLKCTMIRNGVTLTHTFVPNCN